MWESNWGFVIKVMVASVLVSVAIKYGAPFLPIPANSAIALIVILLPASIVATLLGLRTWKQP